MNKIVIYGKGEKSCSYMKAIFSNAMLSCYVYVLFTLFDVLNNNISNMQ